MTPTRPRPHVWPFAALPSAGLIALIAASAGLAQDRPSSPPPSPRAEAKTSPAPGEGQAKQENTSSPATVYDAPRPSPHSGIQGSAHPSPEIINQISYEVRIINLDAKPWRDLVKNRLKLVKQEADVCAWILDHKALFDLLMHTQGEITANVLQAPKITAFENRHALIVNDVREFRVFWSEQPQSPVPLPIVKENELGFWIDVIGSRLPHGTRLSVDLRDSSLPTMGDREVATQHQAPAAIKRRCQTSCDVPESSSLMISVGLHERRGTMREGGRSITSERLFVITPRIILLESEERVGLPPANAATSESKRR